MLHTSPVSPRRKRLRQLLDHPGLSEPLVVPSAPRPRAARPYRLLLAALLLTAATALHSAYQVWNTAQPSPAGLLLSMLVGLGIALPALILWLARCKPRLAPGFTLVSVYAICLGAALSVTDAELRCIALLCCYAAPLCSALMLKARMALVLASLNLLPFALASGALLPLAEGALTLDSTLGAQPLLDGVLFVLLNCALPWVLLRNLRRLHGAHQHGSSAFALYADLFERGSGEAVVICDAKGRVLRANRVFAALFGLDGDQSLQGNKLGDMLREDGGASPDVAPPLDALRRGSEWQTVASEGQEMRRLQVRAAVHTEQGNRALSFGDVTDMRRMQADLYDSEARARFLAHYDAQTGLPNRARLVAWLDESMQRRAATRLLPVLAVRINILRQINARFGSAEGDRVIARFARVLREAAGPGCFVARLRGVVFAVVLPAAADACAAQREAVSLLDRLPAEINCDEEKVRLDLSAGLSLYGGDCDTAIELVRQAEVALDAARRRGERLGLFDRGSAELVSRRVALEIALARCIEHRELRLVYQPKLRANGKLAGFEALLRWESTTLGWVSPAEFIPVAEEAGLVSSLTDYVLDAVCAQIAAWRQQGLDVPRVGVNLSERDLERVDLETTVMGIVERYGVQPEAIELEVTETFLAAHAGHALERLRALRKRGFSIAIDDFGAGYSSLAKLVEMPLSVLKIDRAFLHELPGNRKRERVVRTIVSLARGLELEVVAEGVENAEQLRFLKALGCEAYQGYLFHAPAPAATWVPMMQAAAVAKSAPDAAVPLPHKVSDEHCPNPQPHAPGRLAPPPA